MEYVMLKSYDGSIVRVPTYKKEEYLKTQKLIKMYLNEGKTLDEIMELIDSE